MSAVGARVLGNGREDVGFISLGYPNGVVGHIHVSWADPHKVREVVVVGSDRRIVFNDLDPLERVRVFEKGVKAVPATSRRRSASITSRSATATSSSPVVPVTEPLKHQCGHFLDCIRRGEPPA